MPNVLDDFVEKNVAIARSGCYDYAPQELPSLGLDPRTIPPEFKDLRVFVVYRPSTTLAMNVDKFTKLPLTDEHPPEWVTPQNWKKYAIGNTGDTASIEYVDGSGEVIIRSTLMLMDAEAHRAYNAGIRDVSPGYKAKFVWQKGTAPNGQDYQILMESIEEVNHLAMCQEGRGGALAVIMDSKGVPTLKPWKSGLMWFLKKFRVTKDSDLGGFRTVLEALVAGAGSLTPEEVQAGVSKLREYAADLPDSEETQRLNRYLDDLPQIVGQLDGEQGPQLVSVIADLFEGLDTDAMQDVGGKTMPDEKPTQGTGVPPVPSAAPATGIPAADAAPNPVVAAADPTPTQTQAPPPVQTAAAAPTVAGVGSAEPTAPVKPITLDDVPDDYPSMQPQHIGYMMAELKKLLKAQPANGGATGAAAPIPASVAGEGPVDSLDNVEPFDPKADIAKDSSELPDPKIDLPSNGENHVHVADSATQPFNASMESQRKAKRADDFMHSIWGKTQKVGK